MQSVNVRELKNNPSEALRKARLGPVLVLKGDHPEALLLHLDTEQLPSDDSSILPALAAALYKDGALSLGRAARVGGLSISELITHLSQLGIPVVAADAGQDAAQDMETLEQWLASS